MKRRKPEPRSVMGTPTSVWDSGNRLQMRSQGVRFVLKFSRQADRDHVVEGGPWFFGCALFVAVAYDGLCDVGSVPIDAFPVWAESKYKGVDFMTTWEGGNCVFCFYRSNTAKKTKMEWCIYKDSVDENRSIDWVELLKCHCRGHTVWFRSFSFWGVPYSSGFSWSWLSCVSAAFESDTRRRQR